MADRRVLDVTTLRGGEGENQKKVSSAGHGASGRRGKAAAGTVPSMLDSHRVALASGAGPRPGSPGKGSPHRPPGVLQRWAGGGGGVLR